MKIKFLIYIIIIYTLYIIYLNYYSTVIFKKCIKCGESKLYFVNCKIPFKIRKRILNLFNNNPTKLNNMLNFTKGAKIDYNQIQSYDPTIIKYFINKNLLKTCRKAINKNISFAPNSENYKLFFRLYENNGDKLNWHYDNNFTKGERYTLVIPLFVDKCNTSKLMIKDRKTSIEKKINIPFGKAIIFNASTVFHKVSHQTNGCKRLVAIIPLYEDYNLSYFGKSRKNIRDITFNILSL